MTRLALVRGVVAGSLSALLLLGGRGPAMAQTSADDQALATVLFQKGKALLSEGQVAQACPAFEESQRLDPSGGTILNLALCHELEGRLAHAWSEFNEAVLFARKDGRHDREAAASERARALEPRMSRLTVVVPAGTQVEGLRVEHDGHELARAAWSTPIPVDGGEHVIRASAPGREPFETKVTIANEAESKTVEIPVLATPVVVVSAEKVTLRSGPPAPPPPLSPRLRPIGLATAGAGVVALAVAGVALGAALSAKSDSRFALHGRHLRRHGPLQAERRGLARRSGDDLRRLRRGAGRGRRVAVLLGALAAAGRARIGEHGGTPAGRISDRGRGGAKGELLMGGQRPRGRRRALHLVLVAAATLAGGCNSVFGIHQGTPPPPCYDPGPSPLLIDDMEDGVGDICNLGERQGIWYTLGDGAEGTLSPAQGATFIPAMIPGGRGSSHYAARFTGSGFTGWGALMGFNLDAVGLVNQTVNASAAGGVTFWMKNDVPVSVDFLIPDTVLQTDGGDCVPSASNPNCKSHFSFQITAPNADWVPYSVPFAALTQQHGGTATWNPQLLLGIQFEVASGAAFDVWVDDISFYYCSTGACLPTCTDQAFKHSCPAGANYPAACRPAGADCAAAAKWCADPQMIDDMEDGNSVICNSGGRAGTWYTVADGTEGTVSPAVGAAFTMTPIPGGRGDSQMAAHMTASGFTGWGAQMGLSLNGSQRGGKAPTMRARPAASRSG